MSRILICLAVVLGSLNVRAVEPAPSADAFAIRGIKGLWWDGLENYRDAIPWLADHHLNFLMLCYSSLPASGKDWRADYSADELRGIGELVTMSKARGITLCVSFNPGIWSKPPLEYSSDHDYELVLKKTKSLHDVGVKWIALCLDDINTKLLDSDAKRFGTLQAAQVNLVDHLWHDMKALDPEMKLIFCPSAYTTEEAEKHRDYLETIGRDVDGDIMIFWTGPTVCSSSINSADADHIATMIRRKPFVWDNYPVNDMFPWRALLAPVKNRSADLGAHISGYLANPMKQWQLSKIPVATIAQYVNDPKGYDPAAAINATVAEWPADAQPAMKLLVECYGDKFLGENGYPPHPMDATKLRALRDALSKTESLAKVWKDVQPTLDDDLAKLSK